MTKIQGSPSAGNVTAQTEVQQTTTPQAPTSSSQSSEQSAAPAISPRDVAQRRVEHSLGGLAQEVQLRGRISSASKDSKQDPTSQANQMMQNGQYRQAADTLREHIRTSRSSVTADRLRPMINQAETLADMQSRGVQNIQHPPTQQNVTDYFRTFRGQPIQTIQQGFQNFANAYFEHSASGPMQIGDRRMPENWQDITSMRRSNGRHVIDCEGYAYLGRAALGAAGFSNVLFADMRTGNRNAYHTAISGIRRQGQSTEIAVISNNQFQIGTPQRGQSLDQARRQMLQTEFGNIMPQAFGSNRQDRIIQDADMERAYNRR